MIARATALLMIVDSGTDPRTSRQIRARAHDLGWSEVSQLAAAVPTAAERRHRQEAAAAYVAERLHPGFDAQDVAAGETFWQGLATAEWGPGPAHGAGGSAA
jgi:hypothetical protein